MSEYKSGFVTIIGRPNVGKSTFVNRVIGHKIAIMSDKAQTTRNKIQGVMTQQDAQIVFLDTPGIHKPKHKLGDYMMKVAKNTLSEIDAVMFMVNVNEEIGRGDEYIMEMLKTVKTPVFFSAEQNRFSSSRCFNAKNRTISTLYGFCRNYPYLCFRRT